MRHCPGWCGASFPPEDEVLGQVMLRQHISHCSKAQGVLDDLRRFAHWLHDRGRLADSALFGPSAIGADMDGPELYNALVNGFLSDGMTVPSAR